MSWRLSNHPLLPAVEFSATGGSEVACTVRLRSDGDDATTPQVGKTYGPVDGPAAEVLGRAKAAAVERMAQHPDVYNHCDARAELADLERQLVAKRLEADRLTAIRKSIVAQCRARWRPRADAIAADISAIDAEATALESAIA